MSQRSALCVFILVASLATSACKGSESAKDVKVADPVTVLERGTQPRERLRYKIASGTTTASSMEFILSSMATTPEGTALTVVPGVRLRILAGPAMQTKGGETRYDVRIVKTEPIYSEGTPDQLERDLLEGASVLNQIGGWVEVNDRGMISAANLNAAAQRADIPVRMLVMLINARTTLSRILLPAQPVGIGAKWQAQKRLGLFGFQIDQTDTYTLLSRKGNRLKINVSSKQTAAPQKLSFQQEGVDVMLESYTSDAAGEILIDLTMLSSAAQASGESKGMLQVTTTEGSEPVVIERLFQVRMKSVPLKQHEAPPEAKPKAHAETE